MMSNRSMKMKFAIVAVVLLSLSACAAYREQNYVKRCTYAGFQPGTADHADCVVNLKMESASGASIYRR